MTGNVTTPGPKVTGGAVGHVDLGNKVWPYVYTTTLREQKGYVSGMFGKCMNDGCGEQAQSDGRNLHNMGAFDRWFEGTGYQDSHFWDNAHAGCAWSPENGGGWAGSCTTKVGVDTVGAGYLTSELGNRTIAWLKGLAREDAESGVRRPWAVYFAPHAPHSPATPARQLFTEHYLNFRSNALHCTATARVLIPAECSAVS